MGYVQVFYDLDWPGARRSFERALELSPKYATSHHWFAWYFFMVEEFDEALARLQRAQELDPLSLIINDHLGYALLLAGKPEDALAQLTRTRELDPAFPWTYWRLGSVYLELGRHDDAIAAFGTVVEKTNGGVALGYLGLAYARAGRPPTRRRCSRACESWRRLGSCRRSSSRSRTPDSATPTRRSRRWSVRTTSA
jgi:tetratricopeptide (TPR) repeat protein